jgi:hypothetical protein
MTVLLPPVVTALLIRLDSVFVGPYWSATELVSGMGSLYESYGRRRTGWAVTRRFAYPAIMGFVIAWMERDLSAGGAALLGGLTAFLLLWPIVFHGLPRGVSRSDWMLLPLYGGFIVAFASGAVFGFFLFEYVRAQGNGHPLEYIRDKGLDWALAAVILFIGGSFWGGAQSRIRQRKRQRDDRGYEEIAEQGE